jgi:hypothetical protein
MPSSEQFIFIYSFTKRVLYRLPKHKSHLIYGNTCDKDNGDSQNPVHDHLTGGVMAENIAKLLCIKKEYRGMGQQNGKRRFRQMVYHVILVNFHLLKHQKKRHGGNDNQRIGRRINNLRRRDSDLDT